MAKVEELLAEFRDRLAVAEDGPKPGESREYVIRIVVPRVVVDDAVRDAMLSLHPVEFFTRARLEHAARELELAGRGNVITIALNAFTERNQTPTMSMAEWLAKYPTTHELRQAIGVGLMSAKIIWQAVTGAGLMIDDTANIMKR